MVTFVEKPWLRHYAPGVPTSLEPYPKRLLHDYLCEAALQTPDSVALMTPARLPVFGHQTGTMTFRQLEQQSDALAAALIAHGLKMGDRVAVVMPNVAPFVIAYFAILKAGGILTAINPTYPPEKMQHQLCDCGAHIAITLSLFYKQIKSIQPGTLVQTVIVSNVREYLPPLAGLLFRLAQEKRDGHHLDTLQSGDLWLQDLLDKHAGQHVHNALTPDAVALFQYTGGTTGDPKAVQDTHRALVASLMQIIAWRSVRSGVLAEIPASKLIFLAALPMFHVFGLLIVLTQAIATGGRVILIPNPRDIDNLVDVIHHYKPHVFFGVPALFNAINNHPRVQSGEVCCESVVLPLCGAAPLSAKTKEDFERRSGHAIIEGYGMSEMVSVTHTNPITGVHKSGSVGVPMPDVDCRIVSLSDECTEVPVGEIGELIVRGPNMMLGYHHQPDETANVVRDHNGQRWMHTGDIARMDEDGYFYIVDRKKDMVLIGGYNVYPSNIEAVLKQHPAVLDVGVAGVPHEEKVGQEALKAWIVLKQGVQASAQELIAYCEQHLAPYEVPRRFGFIHELPKTLVGKTLRRELVRLELEAREQV
jgi:long-chain acyl-CoA synthetase